MAFDAEWFKMKLEARLQFALEWDSKPKALWDKVRTTDSTKTVLVILQEIAEHRSNIHIFQQQLGSGFDISKINASYPIDPAMVADTDGVVQSDPKHAGGWWGLLGLDTNGLNADVFVLGGFPMRMPPTTAGFLSTIRHLATTARGSGAGMVKFVNAQRKSVGKKGLHHLALTFNYLVLSNADDLVTKYLKALRGHDPDVTGTVHHMGDMLKLATDVDERDPRMVMTLALANLLQRFPLVFSKAGAADPSTWANMVAFHLKDWLSAIGNHPEALKWLKDELTRNLKLWSDDTAMRTLLKQNFEKERTVSRSRTTVLTTMLGEVRTIRTELQKAVTNGIAKERLEALTRAKTKVDGWRKKSTTTNTVGGGSSQSSETEVEADILIAEGSEKLTFNFSQKLENTTALENEEMGNTTDTETKAMSDKLTTSWQQVITESKAVEETVKQETTRSKSSTDAVTNRLDIHDAFGQHVAKIREGIEVFMSTQGWK